MTTQEKLIMVQDIYKDINSEIWDDGPCERCGARANGSCCGCPEERKYQAKLSPYIEALGKEALAEAVTIGKLNHQIAKNQVEIEKRSKKLLTFLSDEYAVMKEKQAQVEAYFKNIENT